MIPVPERLASPAQLQTATNGRILATDPFVAEAIGAATDAVRSACGWHVAPSRTETDLRLDGRGGSVLTLPSLHVTAVASVVDYGFPDTISGLPGLVLVEDTDFSWSDNGVLERLIGCWSRQRRGIQVTFTHGYDLSDIPGVMLLVCTVASRSITAARMAGFVREQAGTNQAELGKVAAAPINAALLDHEIATLRNFVIPGSS